MARTVACFTLIACFPALASAHPLGFASAELLFEDSAYRLELVIDADSDALEDERRAEIRKRLEAAASVDFPGAESSKPAFRIRSVGVGDSAVDVVEYSAKTPAAAAAVVVRFADVVGDVALEVRNLEGQSVFRQLLPKGEPSPTLSLLSVADEPKTEPEPPPAKSNRPVVTTPEEEPPAASLLSMVRSGFVHILPLGLDHILFVVGLVLTRHSWRRLLLELTTFTLAHSVTLALAMLGVVQAAPAIIEPLIALSIAGVGVSYFVKRGAKEQAHRGVRMGMVFGFGLLHGLGFAGALADTGLASGGLWRALLGFNVGVELGQLVVAGLSGALLVPLATRPHALSWAQRLVAAALIVVGVGWALSRVV